MENKSSTASRSAYHPSTGTSTPFFVGSVQTLAQLTLIFFHAMLTTWNRSKILVCANPAFFPSRGFNIFQRDQQSDLTFVGFSNFIGVKLRVTKHGLGSILFGAPDHMLPTVIRFLRLKHRKFT